MGYAAFGIVGTSSQTAQHKQVTLLQKADWSSTINQCKFIHWVDQKVGFHVKVSEL